MKQLGNLTKVDVENLELRLSMQEDIDSLMEVPCRDMFCHLGIKLIQDGVLRYGWDEGNWYGKLYEAAKVLKIDCGRYYSAIVFRSRIPIHVEVMVFQTSSSLPLMCLWSFLG